MIGRGAGFAPGRFASVAPGRFHDGRFHRGFRRPIFVGSALGLGLYGAYAAYGYPYDDYYSSYYDDSYYADDGGCYIVRQRVLTRYGWRLRPVQVCG